jgi:hypothetical protein
VPLSQRILPGLSVGQTAINEGLESVHTMANVFEADDKGTCTGIAVHDPGREATSTYLPFYSDLKALK